MNIDEVYKLINVISSLAYEGRNSKAKTRIHHICSDAIEQLNHEGLT